MQFYVAEYIVDQLPLVGVVLMLEVPVDAFSVSGDQVFDGPGKGVLVGHFRSRLRSWGRVRLEAKSYADMDCPLQPSVAVSTGPVDPPRSQLTRNQRWQQPSIAAASSAPGPGFRCA